MTSYPPGGDIIYSEFPGGSNSSPGEIGLYFPDLPEGFLEHLGEHLLGGLAGDPYPDGLDALLIQQLARALRFS